MPTILSCTKTTIDFSLVFHIIEKDEVMSFELFIVKDKKKQQKDFFTVNNLGLLYNQKKYSKPYLVLISPPPEIIA